MTRRRQVKQVQDYAQPPASVPLELFKTGLNASVNALRVAISANVFGPCPSTTISDIFPAVCHSGSLGLPRGPRCARASRKFARGASSSRAREPSLRAAGRGPPGL